MKQCKPTGDMLYDGGNTYLLLHDGTKEQRTAAIHVLHSWERLGLISSDSAYLLLSRLCTIGPADLVRQEVKRGG